MNPFNSVRRDLLRVGSLGMAGAALPAFASAAGKDKPNWSSAAIFNVRQFGATGDGKTLDTPAVNRAIEAAAAAGGGTVLFPAGTWLCFSIHLKSYVHLYLESGATILAADSPKSGETTGYNGGTYDAAEPKNEWDAYQDYDHNHWRNALIWGEALQDISITGPGLIWGRGLAWQDPERLKAGMLDPTKPGAGHKSIALKNCRNVLLRDFKSLEGGWDAILTTGVDNLTVDNVTFDSNRGALDIDCCRNVRISNCTVNSPWDDGICLKSSFALGYARPTENVTISNCYVTGDYELGSVLDGTWKRRGASGIGRIKMGTESNGGFINITITGCVFEGCRGYALETVDGALLEDIAIVNTTMRNLSSPPLFMRLGARLRGPKDTTKVGTFKRILVDNLVCHNAPMRVTSILSGIPGYPIEDVKLSNIYIENVGGATRDAAQIQVPEKEESYPEPGMFGQMPSSGFFLRHVRNLEMSHVELATVAPDARPVFYLQDVARADFFSIIAPRTADGAFALHDVKDLRIGWSRAAADTILSSVDSKLL